MTDRELIILDESLKMAELDCLNAKEKMFKSASLLMDIITGILIISAVATIGIFMFLLVNGISFFS